MVALAQRLGREYDLNRAQLKVLKDRFYQKTLRREDFLSAESLAAVVGAALPVDVAGLQAIVKVLLSIDPFELYERVKYISFDREKVLASVTKILGIRGGLELAFAVAVRGTSKKALKGVVIKCTGDKNGDQKVESLFTDGTLKTDPRGDPSAISAGRVSNLFAPQSVAMLDMVRPPKKIQSHNCLTCLQFPAAMSVVMSVPNFKLFVDWLRAYQQIAKIPSSLDSEQQMVASSQSFSGTAFLGVSTVDERLKILAENPPTYKPPQTKQAFADQVRKAILADIMGNYPP